MAPTSPRKILVTSALPYANAPLHLGHMLEQVQADIWVRFQKSRGHDCLYVCADDAHGTAIMLAAEKQGIAPEQHIEQIRAVVAWITDTEIFSPELYYLSQLPADMDTGETASVVIMALILSILATLYPSWRASRLDPVEALRYE